MFEPYSSPPDEDLEVRQHYLEGENISLGIERYRAAQTRTVQKDGVEVQEMKDLGTTTPGQRLTAEICDEVIPAVQEACREAIDGITRPHREGTQGRPAEWWWLIGYLPAEVSAFLACRTILSSPYALTYNGTPLSTTARQIGRAVQDEMEFRNWKTECRQAAKEDGVVDVALLLTNRVKGDIDLKKWKRWKAKVESIKQLGWTEKQQMQIGTKLVQLIVQNTNDWVQVKIQREGQKTVRRVQLTGKAIEQIQSIDEKASMARPYLLPMVAPPRPWARRYSGEING